MLRSLRLPPVAVMWFGLVAAAAGLVPCVALAALGGDLASIDHEQAIWQAERVVTPAVAYDLHELITPAGIRVREYLGRSGRVFAVSWSGPRLPDLGQLLGAYAERYAAAVQSHRATQRALLVTAPDLQLSVTRLPRGFSGQALLPTAVPAGVRRAELR